MDNRKFFCVKWQDKIVLCGTISEVAKVFSDDIIPQIENLTPRKSKVINRYEFTCLTRTPEYYVERSEATRHDWFEKRSEAISLKKERDDLKEERDRLKDEVSALKSILMRVRGVIPLEGVNISGDELEVVNPDTGEVHWV